MGFIICEIMKRVLLFIWKWFLRWLWLGLPLSILSLALHSSFLYRPGFWEIWWLINRWGFVFGPSMFISFPFTFLGLIKGRFYRHFSGLFPCFYLTPAIGIWGIPWLWLLLVPLAALGIAFPPKNDWATALVHLAGTAFAIFVLLHGKMLLEIVLFG